MVTAQEHNYLKHIVHDDLCYYKPKTEQKKKSFAEELSHSLAQDSKFISPKFFYDQKGSELFEEICSLPEYYLTRTEIDILNDVKLDLKKFLNGEFRLVELGSGSSIKTRHILDVLKSSQSEVEYFPIDISEFLEESTTDLKEDYSNLNIVGVIDTYENGLRFIKNYDDSKNLIAFFGSSFGNFPYEEGKEFLKTIHGSMKKDDLFLIGLDLIKDKDVLESAYDDAQGVTAQFNLNVLERINGELGANFNLALFSHHAIYNEEKQRIEMYLRSLEDQDVSIPKANLSLHFRKNELIHTENSHKYSIAQIDEMMTDSGFSILKMWQDKYQKFAMVLLSKI